MTPTSNNPRLRPVSMRLVEMPVPGRLATAIVIAFPGGARFEGPDEVGAAHLLEHMVFKGSAQYPTARMLNRSAEQLGMDLNGATTNDYVELSALVRAESTMPALDLLTDIAGQALLEEEHLEPERAVILQEIADSKDDPSGIADDRLAAALFRGHRLAAPTFGEASDVERLTHAQVLAFRDRQWAPEGGMIVIAGNLDHLDTALLGDLLLRIPDRQPPPPPSPLPPFSRRVAVEERDADVAHLRLAYAVHGFESLRIRDRAAAHLYSNIFGGPPGSRLFEELREQRALCYEIDGYVWGYQEATFLSVDCSLRPSDVAEAYERINAIVDALSRRGPTEEEAIRARAYATGLTALTFDSVVGRSDHAVESIMEYGDQAVEPELYLKALESVTQKDIAELAARVAPGPCVGCVGAVTAALFE
jgi:predicted Zn-dependent peptidase